MKEGEYAEGRRQKRPRFVCSNTYEFDNIFWVSFYLVVQRENHRIHLLKGCCRKNKFPKIKFRPPNGIIRAGKSAEEFLSAAVHSPADGRGMLLFQRESLWENNAAGWRENQHRFGPAWQRQPGTILRHGPFPCR